MTSIRSVLWLRISRIYAKVMEDRLSGVLSSNSGGNMAFTRIKQVLIAAVFITGGTAAAETLKVGVIAPFSGPFATYGTQFRQATEVYQDQFGTSVDGKEIEFIWRDTGGPNPDLAKALAQELVVKDQVDYLAGLVFTPNAFAVAPIAERAQVPTVIWNAATSSVNTKSDYFVRTSFTLPQLAVPTANYALEQGLRKIIITVSDYAPGHDAERAFTEQFTQGGGEIVEQIRMPLDTTDFAPFIQRVKDSDADAVFVFLPAGPITYAYTKAYNDNGLRAAGIDFLGNLETEEAALDTLGDDAIGLVTGQHYSQAHDSEVNHAFVGRLQEMFPGSVANFVSVGAYDGVHVIYEMVAAGGNPAEQIDALKGMSWESPRGPISMDARTRHVTQNIYMRRVAKDENGKLFNEEFLTIADQPDLGYPEEE